MWAEVFERLATMIQKMMETLDELAREAGGTEAGGTEEGDRHLPHASRAPDARRLARAYVNLEGEVAEISIAAAMREHTAVTGQ